MSFSILHVSDLHRDLKDEVGNQWLLDSLETDFRQFQSQNPAIPMPSVCIVSGDLVYGAQANAANAEDELVRQYAQAEEFLIGLTDRWLDGDRERVVLIPGNHDVSYRQVLNSAARILVPPDPDSRTSLVRELFTPNSALRWSWSELCFYRITDQVAYNNRLQHFADTYTRFYRGRRSYSLNPEKQFDIFDFPDYRFCVAALNSCFNNDPLQRSGSFHPGALTEICRLLRQPSAQVGCRLLHGTIILPEVRMRMITWMFSFSRFLSTPEPRLDFTDISTCPNASTNATGSDRTRGR